MLSLKANLASSSSSFNKSEVLTGPSHNKLSQVALCSSTSTSSQGDPVDSGLSSVGSLVDSLASSCSNPDENDARAPTNESLNHASSSNCNNLNKPSGLLKKAPNMKSSYALTAMLQQQPDLGACAHEGQNDSLNNDEKMNSALPPNATLAAAMVANAQLNGGSVVPPCPETIIPAKFGQTLQDAIAKAKHGYPDKEPLLNFRDSSSLRQALEPSLRHARKVRDSCKKATTLLNVPPMTAPSMALPMSSWVGLPYASLREERPFLYDHMHTHPLSDVLSRTLGIDDLSQLHQTWDPTVESAKEHQRRLFQPLVEDRVRRQAFHQAYESFVTSCCIPLLHASALQKNVLNSSSRNRCSTISMEMMMNMVINAGGSIPQHLPQHHHGMADPVVYRYQVFPTINVVYPDDPDACVPPTCDLSHGRSVGWLHFHIPLTASVGTSALYCENFPGREDWHPLRCSSVGLGYCWDGARCLRFVPLNTTGKTRVSLDFRILLVRASTIRRTDTFDDLTMSPMDSGTVDDDTLCRSHHLQDIFTRIPGFYEEATMDIVGASKMHRSNSNNGKKSEPDARCGFPFD